MNFHNPFNSHPKAGDDLGFGNQIDATQGRLIRQDGSFNVERTGIKAWTPYQDLVEMSWTKFLCLILVIYILINAGFAALFVCIGIENISGVHEEHGMVGNFLHAFFFSVQTFTTVGYGAMSPSGLAANIIASMDAIIGLMAFALFTGLLFARFSSPKSSIAFSEKAIISPYESDLNSLQVRIVNCRDNKIIDLNARLTMAWHEEVDGIQKRHFANLELERSTVFLFPLNWTLVHPINKNSPLYNKTARDCKKMQIEILVLVEGHDETYAQIVHSNSSYIWEEVEWDVSFEKMYYPENGTTVLDLNKLSETTKIR
ncbi:MAG: inward rectifier potassium channel [Paraglaciecola sp.]|jgi:inward rectifier potassium channel